MNSDYKRMTLNITSFKEGSLPFKHLGCLLFKGRAKKDYFSYIVEKFHSKLVRWKSINLSKVGRMILVKHTFRSLPIFIMSLFNIPTGTIQQIESILSNFFWEVSNNKSKTH
jgi:hypothetical protein